MKKIWIRIGVVVIVALVIALFVTQTKKESEVIKIWAILPLTGDGAKYGFWTKEGIELAAEEINLLNKRINIQILYEDDKGKPQDAVIF